MTYEITRRKSVTTITFQVKGDWQQSLLLQSDLHWDSAFCNRTLLDRHLKKAKQKGALIMAFGDVMDGMQGRYDPRRSYDSLRPEFKVDKYYDAITDGGSKYFLPYAQNYILMADGNHEKSVIKNAGTSLLDHIVRDMNKAGGNVGHGEYGGYVRLMFKMGDTNVGTIRIKYFHGSGGEAPVTRGAIQTNRQAVVYANADVVVNGHSHHNFYIPIAREYLNDMGNVEFGLQHHIRIPGYHDAYGDGSTGWEAERGGVPKPLGAAWMHLSYDAHNKRVIPKFEMDIEAPRCE